VVAADHARTSDSAGPVSCEVCGFDATTTAPPATPSASQTQVVYDAVLRNGFSIRHDHQQKLQGVTRLYLSANPSSALVDVPTEEIVSVERQEIPRNTQQLRPSRILITDFRSFIGLEESVLFRSQLEESLTRECGSSCTVVQSGEYDKILTGDWDLSIRNVDGRGTMIHYVPGTMVLIGRNGAKEWSSTIHESIPVSDSRVVKTASVHIANETAKRVVKYLNGK
jgi:hypothetical protein